MTIEFSKDAIKEALQAYVESITQKSKGGMYICPLCGSGTGKNKTGAFGIYRKDGAPKWKCQACGEGGDIFDLIGKHEGITDRLEQLKRGADFAGIPLDLNEEGRKMTDTHRTYTQAHTHKEKPADPAPEADYTDFFKKANADLPKTTYHRGISLETLNRFLVGYVAEYASDHKPRLIIPTSKSSFQARYAGDPVPDGVDRYKKSRGAAHIFNKKALYTAQKPVFVVEGEIDALSIIDAGGEAVGLGSASAVGSLLRDLERQAPAQPLIIALDNDQTGEEAAGKLCEGLKGLHIPFYRASVFGSHKDANEALNADKAALQAAIAQAEAAAQEAGDDQSAADLEELKSEAVGRNLQGFLDRIKASRNAKAIKTGFPSLDKLLDGGLYAGLYIIGAISSLGKTTFCLQIADQIAAAGENVLIFSLEMSRDELIAKSVSRLSLDLDLERNNSTKNAKTTRGILAGSRYSLYSDTEKEIIKGAIEQYSTFAGNIYITEGVGNIGVQQIVEAVKRFQRTTGKAPVVLIDYIQILAPADPRSTDKQNTDKAVLELKRLSRDYSIPVIGISSFNRENYTAPVNLAAFKESGAIEYSSDVLIGLQYDGMDYSEADGKGETDGNRAKRIREVLRQAQKDGNEGKAQKVQAKVMKNRNGQKGDIVLSFYPLFNLFREPDEF